jgi:hypothetical protein
MSGVVIVRFLGAVVAAALAFGPFAAPGQEGPISVASFNIQFLGHFKDRDNGALADLMAPHDLVFIQELVAPPYPGTFPDGTPYVPDPEAAAFFEAMRAKGFAYVLSEEDTGSGASNHLNSPATEWFAAFYRPGRVAPAADLAHGFLGEDRSNHPDYERVPYAFPFRAGQADLVFISVHLQPGASARQRARRAHELTVIGSWIASRPGSERDYVILGDMNIEDCDELAAVLPAGYASLNADCLATNTNPRGPKPYDHVLYQSVFSANEVGAAAAFEVVDLVAAMRPHWPPGAGPYPGSPYRHNEFRTRYSDHHPVAFAIGADGPDDD